MPPQDAVPFKIAVPDGKIQLLRQKLDLVNFPDELDDSGLKYGAPLADIRRLVARWKEGYDWRTHEAALNAELPQFTLDIPVEGFGTLNIHFVHQRSKVGGAIPLLFVHGWPGSFIEVQKLLPLLTEPSSAEHPSFHVVALSLPGYGFSQAPTKQGFASAQYAEVGHKLMLALGYDAYVMQGGDWGARITRVIAVKYGGTHAKAWHTNLPLGAKPPISRPLLWLKDRLMPLTAVEKEGMQRSKVFDATGRGYFQEQATQPQTIGYSLADSPVGLLAWIYEKLVNWTDGYPWGDDEVLTWVSIYLFSRAGPTASVRIYYETRQEDAANAPKSKPSSFASPKMPIPKIKPSTIPMGASYFAKEIRRTPKTWTQAIGNLKFVSEHAHGGHFAAHEKPSELADDLRKFFGRGGAAAGVVPGKSGYN
ncbi:alpha/beta-hydrolase [Desarmillaria tabescens]|uniref:Alpha/beta-hydrolase n=1 Tax=Armillaria tabescens TaxID=1929756 RepID=A0AA39NFM0_ARMTA|nr:alpha/beta-hydrolase [Desarmillaria tabescens]KAK0464739.1 alpha/beta-hydrolase [Desarmillaria tabescens]